MIARRVLRPLIAASVLAAIPVLVFAQDAEPIDAPEGFAEVRERFESMSAADAEAAGYRPAPPVCIANPETGEGMGIHYLNQELWDAQFASGEMDPENPPIILFNGDSSQVVGVEWEVADLGQGEPELFGQTVTVLAGHPGLEEPHYMLHAYFRPDGQVLFAEWDPELSCPQVPATSVLPDDGRSPLTAAGVALIGAALLSWVALSTRPFRGPADVHGR